MRRRCAQTPWKIALFTSMEEPEIDHGAPLNSSLRAARVFLFV